MTGYREYEFVMNFLSQKIGQKGYTDFNIEDYTNICGQLELGRFLGLLDIMSGNLAHQVVDSDVVTAAMESVTIVQPLTLDFDYHVKLFPTKVWNSSLEVCAEVSGNDGREKRPLVDFYFTFVGIGDDGRPKQFFGPIELSSTRHDNTQLEYEAQQRKDSYKALVKKRLTLDDIAEEMVLIRDLQKQHDIQGSNFGVKVSDTEKEYNDLAKPSQRNYRGKLFGGDLLERTFEHLWTHGYRFSKGGMPIVAAINRVNFLAPVDIGSILINKVKVNYSGDTSFEIEDTVYAENPSTGKIKLVTTCLYTMVKASRGKREPTPLGITVVPHSDGEMIKWAQAHRMHEAHLRSRGYKSDG